MTNFQNTEESPVRGRVPRSVHVAGVRRRRNAGSLNRMGQMKLDCIEPADLDLKRYVYRWINDEPGRIRDLTRNDDYDFVPASGLGAGFDLASTDSESEDRVRMLVGTSANGKAQYTYLARKPRSFWEADNEEVVAVREAQMAGVVYEAQNPDADRARPDEDKYYAPRGNTIGGAAQRRRGPVPTTKLKG